MENNDTNKSGKRIKKGPLILLLLTFAAALTVFLWYIGRFEGLGLPGIWKYTGNAETILSAPVTTVSPENEPVPEISEDKRAIEDSFSSRTNYDALKSEKNAAKMQNFYDKLVAKALEFHTSSEIEGTYTLKAYSGKLENLLVETSAKVSDKVCVAFELATTELSFEEVNTVWMAFNQDHPLYYWSVNTLAVYGIHDNEKNVDRIYIPFLCYNDYQPVRARQEMNQIIYDKVKSIAQAAKTNNSIYGQALYVHDSICNGMDYKYIDGIPDTSRKAITVESFFTSYGSVCQGYSVTFQLIMNYLGIECLTVNNLSHAWNMIKLDDGQWYWIDLTWDDQESGLIHNYFCKNDTEDIWEGSGYSKPESFKDNTFLGSQNHELSDTFPARSEHPYTGARD